MRTSDYVPTRLALLPWAEVLQPCLWRRFEHITLEGLAILRWRRFRTFSLARCGQATTLMAAF
uniref:Uncharacterized protein n=1 Tax=Picea glauca TaxID=3330 RepID=A0A101LW84_PICGL|nr:hypothetical protein ABT39_MTgene1615 [Picea glauca]